MRITKETAALIIVSCLTLSVILYSAFHKSAEPAKFTHPTTQMPPPIGESSASAELPSMVAATPVEVPKPPALQPTLHQQLMNARDLRVLYLKLLQQGDEGGGLYAMNILMRCSAARQRSLSTPFTPQSAEQSQAKAFIDEQCASFIDSEISMDAVVALSRDARLKNDRLRSLLDNWVKDSKTAEGREIALKSVLQSRDPLLLEQLAGAIFTNNGATTFNGTKYKESYALPILSAAWLSAICDGLQTQCNKLGDPYLMEGCVTQNSCFGTRYELFVDDTDKRFGKEGGELFRSIYPRMVEAIRNQDTSAFDAKIN